jgi:subfamily B ATP-binding cassette protein HlyB/CyaB
MFIGRRRSTEDPNKTESPRRSSLLAAARHYGVQLVPADYWHRLDKTGPSPAALVAWARRQRLDAKALRTGWNQLLRAQAHLVLLLRDGGTALLEGADQARRVMWLRDLGLPSGKYPVRRDALRLSQNSNGKLLVTRRALGVAETDEPFSLGWLMRLVGRERPLLRDIAIASVTLSALTIVPPLLVMSVVDRVVVHHSLSTLILLCVLLAVTTLYETVLGYSRRELVQVVSTRVDTKLNLHMFARVLALPVAFFEKNPAGETNYKVSQIWRVRDFLTGKLMGTCLDLFTLVFLLPFLFWLEPTLAWMVLACSTLIALIILAFMPPLRRITAAYIKAASDMGGHLMETLHGMLTVKVIAVEEQRQVEWHERVAEAGRLRLWAGRLANWSQSLIAPLESFLQRGVLMVGAYMALQDATGVAAGGLVAFMMLGGRAAQPMVGLARLLEDFEQARASIGAVGQVLNSPAEAAASRGDLRPKLEGAIRFEDLTFTYPGAKTPALEGISFEVPVGTMLGVVGRSGSGKTTITRLLQGIHRDYTGFLKLDGAELRAINLEHLRRSLGVVPQDTFLFRGTVRDNITVGRPGLTMEEVIGAARLAGAEEFIERMPKGYETEIAEGSANLSGGQRQRLAIARALITNPNLMIMDEVTSALDPESEALVNANLRRLSKGRTMIIVSHRLSSLVDCDQILVMEKGRVADLAPHTVLLERCAIYRHLWVQQHRHLLG